MTLAARQAPRLRSVAGHLRAASSHALPQFVARQLDLMAMQADVMDGDWDEQCGPLAQALDAVLDEALAAFQADETDQGVALVVAAAATVDSLLAAMGLPDIDESEPMPGMQEPMMQMNAAGPIDMDIVRALDARLELRADATDSESLGILSGHFSSFNNWYSVQSFWEGEFLERVAPGTFLQTIREDRQDMRILYDHGFDPQIGNKVLAPIDDLREDKTGGYYEGGLFDTSYNRDLLPGLKKGVYGASMRMRVVGETWDDDPGASAWNPKGVPERTITRAKLAEFGPVTFPANPGASAGVRSGTDRYYEQLRRRDSGAYAVAIRAARRLPPTGRPGAGSAGGGDSSGAAPGNGDRPLSLSAAQARRHRDLLFRGIIRA